MGVPTSWLVGNYDRDMLRVTRGEFEMYVRPLEGRGYAASTVARRFGTVATVYWPRSTPTAWPPMRWPAHLAGRSTG